MVGERGWHSQHARCSTRQMNGAAIPFLAVASDQFAHPNRGDACAVGVAGNGINFPCAVADCNNLWNVKSGFYSNHPGGAMFVFVDGSVHFLSETINLTTFRRLADRRDGNPVSW